MVVSPEMETMHDADGYMRQYYPNGVMLEADKTTGDVKVYDRDGNVSLSVEHAKISKLNEIQHHAKSL
jgi:antitoxin component YwqK of YwqJK toxin-antitoxin module